MNRTRNGKIARLPAETRNTVNELLNDGVEYQRIIEWLDQQGHPGFNHSNISRWRDGGFQDWLAYTQRLDEQELKLEWARQLANSPDTAQFQRAALNLTSIQFFDLLNRFQTHALSRTLDHSPEKYFSLLNSIARLTREFVNLEAFRSDQQESARREAAKTRVDKGGLTPLGRQRVCRELNLLVQDHVPAQITSPTNHDSCGDLRS